MNDSYIAIDWGSTNLRAWLYLNGACVDETQSEAGVTRLNGQTPQQVFQNIVAPWRRHDVPVVMAGMIGSNAGWLSVPYLPCPIRLTDVARRLTRVDAAKPLAAWIIPGLSIAREDNSNVIRGEETQLIGAYDACPSSLYLMPGTHSKWVQMDGDAVIDFRTVMTGELHHLLLKQSLIGVGIGEQQPAPDAFQRGLEQGFADENIIRCLFETRAAHVLGRLEKSAVSDWLSGLLIGNEVAQMQRQYRIAAGTNVTIIGNPALGARYQQALLNAGLRVQSFDGDQTFQAGIRSIVNELEY
ncbi:2-dehydro-3-deoxygalactonokinase [Brenneria goodwinii]|uniref:2-dehydro-3-deoxygalactonokinase n=1 Tax=Brenneria goodwinii TaxID=1109412 RepID=UPI000EF228B3|nr:2-dehydro-3-deoxygalactonokinase [Brenneria goodwinii]MCG8157827.1 2-dehydro-3-deoxygalactonokinase [Brenneria goodwinii]MCG8162869.1 2-dehydro-3-deoxygalactonokinase [Brenneria goodwinii]MCG8165091.1 2-dehydro-3-deoxygalactonokinase [Brenneria goodwinii]MCG8171623.1 2-dehydro-3-deoxygalactonokinase [Brenneria goodwinii]MCG8176854.1 2-dehydro-3-deoxygalactonokinase [Brenneria goodwinii]